jgi:site-specific recombinase XerD
MIALIDEFRKELSDIAEFAPSTVDNYVACVVGFFDYAQHRLLIDPVFAKSRHIIDWIGSLQKQGLSKSRLDHYRSSLQLFFALLVKLHIVRKNPADHFPVIRKYRASDKNKPVPQKVVKKLLKSIVCKGWYGRRDYVIIAMLWALGVRVSELTGLRVKDFEPDHDVKNRIGLIRVRGKNKKQRALFVVDNLYDALVDYLSHELSPKKKNAPLFPIEAGTAISKNRVLKMIKERAQSANITHRVTPHVLRHCFATEMYNAGVPLSAIQTMLGHNYKAETAIYVHVGDNLHKKALEQITIEGELSWW